TGRARRKYLRPAAATVEAPVDRVSTSGINRWRFAGLRGQRIRVERTVGQRRRNLSRLACRDVAALAPEHRNADMDDHPAPTGRARQPLAAAVPLPVFAVDDLGVVPSKRADPSEDRVERLTAKPADLVEVLRVDIVGLRDLSRGRERREGPPLIRA